VNFLNKFKNNISLFFKKFFKPFNKAMIGKNIYSETFNYIKRKKGTKKESTPFRTVPFFSKVKVSFRTMARNETLK
jgi:hypothetical protein